MAESELVTHQDETTNGSHDVSGNTEARSGTSKTSSTADEEGEAAELVLDDQEVASEDSEADLRAIMQDCLGDVTGDVVNDISEPLPPAVDDVQEEGVLETPEPSAAVVGGDALENAAVGTLAEELDEPPSPSESATSNDAPPSRLLSELAESGLGAESEAAEAFEAGSAEARATESAVAEAEIAGLDVMLSHLAVADNGRAATGTPSLPQASVSVPGRVLSTLDLAGVAKLIASGGARHIVCVCGAGISVSAGIPDFRTPGTGLYSQLAKYNLPRPEAIFDIDFFRRNPKPFHLLAKELFPGMHAATPTHHFMRLLHDRGLLLRCYTQNIDSLEAVAGLPRDKVVAAHGNFDSAHCIACEREYSTAFVKEAVFQDVICTCEDCGYLVKPDIVFFGENLPARFFEMRARDALVCDAMLVMGTSLVVHPFAGMIGDVKSMVPRLLINRERVGEARDGFCNGFVFEPEEGAKDAVYLGDCDDGVRQLAELLGWSADLDKLVKAGAAHKESVKW